MRNKNKFISSSPEYEPLAAKCPAAIFDEYVKNDAERAITY